VSLHRGIQRRPVCRPYLGEGKEIDGHNTTIRGYLSIVIIHTWTRREQAASRQVNVTRTTEELVTTQQEGVA
jgi:hypothetical protein